MLKHLTLIVVLLFVLANFACNSMTVEKLYHNGMVVSASPIAGEIGRKILQDGGNAVDAAVAVGFAMSVCFPEAGNIGGGGFALVYDRESGRMDALDFRETAPGRASPAMFLDSAGEYISGSSLVGAGAAGVPGTVAGLFELWRKYGSREWYELVQPAYMLADTGFIVDKYLAGSLDEYAARLSRFPETRAIFLRHGRTPSVNEKLIQEDLASTLERISIDSTDGFYSGYTADLIVAAMEKHGGLISLEDLKDYRPVWRQPIMFRFDSLDIYSMPPPSSGGVIMAMIMKILEAYDFQNFTAQSPEYIHLFTEACRLAYAERAMHLGDPDFIDNPVKGLLDPAYIETRRKLIDPERAGISSEISSDLPSTIDESESTTHFSVADRFGNLVSLTYTINTAYGSKLVVDGAGFLLNNEMDDFSLKPGLPNVYGLVGGRANAVEPGKRMLSSMSPTIILKGGDPFLVLGSPGGSKIITAVAEVIINLGRMGMNAAEAVRQPRFHHQWLPDTLYLEGGGFGINIKQDLISRGHNIKELDPFGTSVQMIYFDNSGAMSGISDPRQEGAALGY